MDYPEVEVQRDATKALLLLEDRIHHLERLLEDRKEIVVKDLD